MKKYKDPYIIAEVGQAHDGSLGILHSYIDAVAETGAMQSNSRLTLQRLNQVSLKNLN